jgi:hypothetical protein
MANFESDIHALASKIAEEAQQDGVSLQDRLDSLGKLTAYYAAYLKAKGGDDDEPQSFAEVIDRARVQAGASPAVGGRERDPVNGGTSAIPIGRRAR